MLALLLSLRHALRVHKLLLISLMLGLVAPWLIFVNVAEDIWEHGGFIGDEWILELLHAHATSGLDKLALALTAAGDPVPMSVLTLIITLGLAVWGTRPKAWFFGLSVGGAMALNLLVKLLFARPRPDLWLSIKPSFYYSFPSGHAMGTAAVATALGFLMWQHRGQKLVWTLGALLAVGVGWSRLYLGVHYPSDVLAGWTGSVGWVAGLHVLFSPEFHQLRQLWHAGLHRLLPRLVPAPLAATGQSIGS